MFSRSGTGDFTGPDITFNTGAQVAVSYITSCPAGPYTFGTSIWFGSEHISLYDTSAQGTQYLHYYSWESNVAHLDIVSDCQWTVSATQTS